MTGLIPTHGSRNIEVVTVSGDLAQNASALRTELIDALGRRGPRLVLDLAGVSTCDESIIRVIEEASARAWRRGGWLRLAGAPPCVVTCIQAIYGTGGPTMYASVAEAMAAPARSAVRPSVQQ